MSDEIADIFDAAADYIEANGHWQGTLFRDREGGPACAVGALCRVLGFDGTASLPAEAAKVNYLTDRLDVTSHEMHGMEIVALNDLKYRRADFAPPEITQKVLDVLRKAAKEERS